VTPGRDDTRSRICGKVCRRLSVGRKRRDNHTARTPPARKPGRPRAAARSFQKQPGPNQSIRERPISLTASSARTRRRVTPEVPLPSLPQIVIHVLTRACQRGSDPEDEAARAKRPRRMQARAMHGDRLAFGQIRRNQPDSPSTPTWQSGSPRSRPPSIAPGFGQHQPDDAPGTRAQGFRMAISLRRPLARASSRFATLAQAISSTRQTAPSNTSRAGRTLRTSCSALA